MKPKKLSKSLARKETIEGEAGDVGGDSLPSYARTYILPRKMTLAGQSLPSTMAKFDPSLVKQETMLTMEKMKTLVPCVGTERLREYANFIKEGNFYPVTVLDPEVGKSSILSRERARDHEALHCQVSTMRSSPSGGSNLKRRGLRLRKAKRKGEERSKASTRLSGRLLWLWRPWRETPKKAG